MSGDGQEVPTSGEESAPEAEKSAAARAAPSNPSEDKSTQERERAIRRGRASRVLRSISWTVGGAQLLFWSFAFGAAFGPAPLNPAELVAGALFSMACGLTLCSLTVRRGLEGDALTIARVREGKRRRRMVVFAEFVILEDEVILRQRIKSAKLTDQMDLELMVDEGEAGTPAIARQFSGSRVMLARVRDELASS